MIRRLLSRLRPRKCEHDWFNTGESMPVPGTDAYVVLRQCIHCHQTLIVEV